VGGLTCGAVKVLCQQVQLDVWDSHSRLYPTGLSARQRAVFGHGRTDAAMQAVAAKERRPQYNTLPLMQPIISILWLWFTTTTPHYGQG